MTTKTCSRCKTPKLVKEFYTNRAKKDNLSTECRACNIVKSKAYYVQNKEKMLANKARQNQVNREKWIEYLIAHPCVDCGESDVVVLQADHQRDKVRNISRMIQGWSWEAILLELEKCEIVCANCHHRRTARSQGWFKSVSREG